MKDYFEEEVNSNVSPVKDYYSDEVDYFNNEFGSVSKKESQDETSVTPSWPGQSLKELAIKAKDKALDLTVKAAKFITNPIDPNGAIDNLFDLAVHQEKESKDQVKDESFIQTVKEGWSKGTTQTIMANEYFKEIAGLPNEASKYAKILEDHPEWDAENPLELSWDYAKKNPVGLLKHAVRGVAEQVPIWLSSMKEGLQDGLVFGTGFAGIAAIAGQAGPQVALPEELITVPGAASVGMTMGLTTGAFRSMSAIEAGHAYKGMLDMDIDPEIARNASAVVGYINGVIELSQLNQVIKTIPGGEALMKNIKKNITKKMIKDEGLQAALKKVVTNYGKFLSAEVSQEVVQEVVTIGGEVSAQVLDEHMNGKEFEMITKDQLLSRLGQTAGQSALTFALSGVPGHLMQTYNAVKESGSVDARANALLKEAERHMALGDHESAAAYLQSAKETVGIEEKDPLRKANPLYDRYVEDLRYISWLKDYSPMSTRGTEEGLVRGIKYMDKDTQLGENAQLVKPKPLSLEDFNIYSKYSPPLPLTEVKMDLKFITKLNHLQDLMGKEFRITSGYRTEEHNNRLAEAGYPTIKDSRHMSGLAADVLTSTWTKEEKDKLKKEAKKAGFVIDPEGSYKNHIHLERPTTKSKKVSTQGNGPRAGGKVHGNIQSKLGDEVSVTGVDGHMSMDRDHKVKDSLTGKTKTLKATEEYIAYRLSNGKILFQDGEQIVIDENELENIPATALGDEGAFYSKSEKILEEKMDAVATVEQILGMLRNQVPKDDLKWSGLEDWLGKDPKSKVTKAEIMRYMSINSLKVEIETLSKDETKFEEYTEPGGTNYQEHLIRWNPKQPFTGMKSIVKNKRGLYDIIASDGTQIAGNLSKELADEELKAFPTDESYVKRLEFKGGHFGKTNVIVHVRTSDRKGPNGEKVLFIEEIQSDWHSKGRKEGYANPEGPRMEALRKHMVRLSNIVDSTRTSWEQKQKAEMEMAEIEETPGYSEYIENDFDPTQEDNQSNIPDAPFKGESWTHLAMKQMIKKAVEEGYDRIALVSGDQTTERYDLSKKLRKIEVWKDPEEGWYGLKGYVLNSGRYPEIEEQINDPKKLEDYVGKELASKILEDTSKDTMALGKLYSYSGLDLKSGGEWARTLYDKVVPGWLKKYLKQYDSQVEETQLQKSRYDYKKILDDVEAKELLKEGAIIYAQDIESPNVYRTVDSLADLNSLMEEGTDFYLKFDNNLTSNKDKKTLSNIRSILVDDGGADDFAGVKYVLKTEMKKLENKIDQKHQDTLAEFIVNELDWIQDDLGTNREGYLRRVKKYIQKQNALLEERKQAPGPKQLSFPITSKMRNSILSQGQPLAGGKYHGRPFGRPDIETPQTTRDKMSEQVFARATGGQAAAGILDAKNYNRWLAENDQGRVQKVIINPAYLGDYYTLRPSANALKKAVADDAATSSRAFNHWMDNIKNMKHPEHGQGFIAPKYEALGDTPNFPDRIYPWIKIKEPAPMPTKDVPSGMTKISSPGQIMREAWGLQNPLVDAFEAGQVAGKNVENNMKWIAKISKGIDHQMPNLRKLMQPYVDTFLQLKGRLAVVTEDLVKQDIAKKIAQNFKEAYDTQIQLAKNSPDVRIALYAEESLPADIVSLMSDRELKIGELVKAYYAKTGKDMQRVGIPVINNKIYTRHVIANEMREAMSDWDKIPAFIQKHIPRDMAFSHRDGSFNWYPSMIGSLTDYTHVVEKKLAFQPYILHWKPTVEKAAQSGSVAGQAAKDMITRNMYKNIGFGEKVGNFITSTNYFLQLFMNARVAVKHIIGGFPAAISEIGPWTLPKVVASFVKHPFQSQEMVNTFGRLKDIVKTLEVTSGMDVQANRLIQGVQGQPTTMVEWVESGINILGNLIKGGQAKDMDPEVLRSYIWNKVTSVNFRGGWDIPATFSNPIGRVAFQYSLEPHKVWEYRIETVMRAIRGEKDIYGTHYGSKVITYIMILGAMEAMARGFGKTIMDTLGGTPYIDLVSPTSKPPYAKLQAKMKMGPGVNMVAGLAKAATQGDAIAVVNRFVDYGLESGVGLLGQLMKAGSGTTPDVYDGAVNYLLGFPEVKKLEEQNSRVSKYLKYRNEKEEMLMERKIIRKNPILTKLVVFKRLFRNKLRAFLSDPGKHLGKKEPDFFKEEQDFFNEEIGQ